MHPRAKNRFEDVDEYRICQECLERIDWWLFRVKLLGGTALTLVLLGLKELVGG